MPDLRRVFQYHAAEHKAINAYEDGAELTPESVQSYSKIHLRCGTAFLLWVMVIAIFVFALVGRPDWPVLIASRILLLPVIAGLAYEVIRFGGKHPENPVVRTLLAPGAVAAVADHARADARPGRGVDPGARERARRRGAAGARRLGRRSHGLSRASSRPDGGILTTSWNRWSQRSSAATPSSRAAGRPGRARGPAALRRRAPRAQALSARPSWPAGGASSPQQDEAPELAGRRRRGDACVRPGAARGGARGAAGDRGGAARSRWSSATRPTTRT